jgi:crotonobetainyl-CoA:carnitine CoA-transferase CaiB-like acyl-CoA transferase
MRTRLKSASKLRVVVLAMGLAPALMAKIIAEVGAHVDKVAPPEGDPFYDVYPAYGDWLEGCHAAPRSDLDELLKSADACIIGGEDFPGLEWTFDAEALRKSNRRLIVIDIRAYAFKSWQQRPASDLLVQALTGLVNDQYSQRPMLLAVPAPSIGAAVLGLLGMWSALLQRESSGAGQTVTTSLQQGAALFWHQHWSLNRGVETPGDLIPKDVQQPIMRCADGKYAFLLMGVPGGLAKLYRVLGIDQQVDPNDKGNPNASRGPRNYFLDYDLVAAHVAKFEREALFKALRSAGLPAEPVLAPGECWDDPQVVQNRLLKTLDNGDQLMDTPFTIRHIGDTPWERHPAPQPDAAPLAGVRVLDFGMATAGPFASKLLADLGADVIKVDSPATGKLVKGSRHGGSATRGKRSVLVDAKLPEGMDVLKRLCASAHVVHHNFRVGVAERVGIDPATLREANPNVLTLHSSAFGSVGPKAKDSGFDMVVAAYSGLDMLISGDGPLTWYRCPVVDYMAASLGAVATVMGLFEARVGGGSIEMECSLLEASQFLLSQLVRRPDGTSLELPALDASQTKLAPGEALYQTKDAWIAVSTRSAERTQRVADVLGIGHAYQALDSSEARTEALAARLRTLGTDEAIRQLSQAGVWVERCTADALTALLDNPEAWESGMMIRIQERNGRESLSCLGPLVTFSQWQDQAPHLRLVPIPGEHTRSVLTEIGFTAEEIDQLAAKHAIDFQ